MTIEVTQQNRLLIVGKRYERHLWRLCGKTACARTKTCHGDLETCADQWRSLVIANADYVHELARSVAHKAEGENSPRRNLASSASHSFDGLR